MSCTICKMGLDYPAGAHAVGCEKRTHLDRAQRIEQLERTIGEWPTCQLAMCGGACGADECGT